MNGKIRMNLGHFTDIALMARMKQVQMGIVSLQEEYKVLGQEADRRVNEHLKAEKEKEPGGVGTAS